LHQLSHAIILYIVTSCVPRVALAVRLAALPEPLSPLFPPARWLWDLTIDVPQACCEVNLHR
jgi:hypothetical protein